MNRMQRAERYYGRQPDILHGRVRATDSDRDLVLGYLSKGFQQGAISQEEFSLRTELALHEYDKASLDELCGDLPLTCTATLPELKPRSSHHLPHVSKATRHWSVAAAVIASAWAPWLHIEMWYHWHAPSKTHAASAAVVWAVIAFYISFFTLMITAAVNKARRS